MTDTDRTQPMKDVDHTHPYNDTSAGTVFRRGPVVTVDGGRREEPSEKKAEETMKEVDHEPPEGGEGSNRVFERGYEHEDDEDEDDV
ncbi:hypothetical protein ACFQH6_16550 [Halobacteriaceae archaeon GCM10025711]